MSKGLPRSRGRGNPQLGGVQKKVFHLSALALSVSAVSTAVGWGTAIANDFPEGNLQILGVVANLQFTSSGANITATWTGNFSLGSTPTADFTLSGTDADFLASTALAAATAKVSPVTRGANGTPFILDNTDGSLELNLNLLIAAATITDDTTVPVTVTGEIYVAYIVLGDD